MSNHFFEAHGSTYVPTERCLGPWSRGVLHGGPVCALLAHAIEEYCDDEALQPVRLTVDLFRAAPLAPMEVQAYRLRNGSRVKVLRASMLAENRPIAVATALYLRPGEDNDDPLPLDEPFMQPPEAFEAARRLDGPVSHATSLELRGDARHRSGGHIDGLWVRSAYEFMPDTPLSPFVRVAMFADWANPAVNFGPAGITFINVDITLYLVRLPVSDWIGIQPCARHGQCGLAVGDCIVHDLDGAVGRAVVGSIGTPVMATAEKPAG